MRLLSPDREIGSRQGDKPRAAHVCGDGGIGQGTLTTGVLLPQRATKLLRLPGARPFTEEGLAVGLLQSCHPRAELLLAK